MAEQTQEEEDSDIIDAISGAVTDSIEAVAAVWSDIAEATANDPCRAAVEYGGMWRAGFLGRFNEGAAVLATVSGDLRRTVNLAIEKWGRPDTRYVTVPQFSTYLISNNVVQVDDVAGFGMLFGGPPGALIALLGADGYLNNHLPAGSGSRRPSANTRGLQLSPGVYVYKPGATWDGGHFSGGRLQGPAVRAAWEDWIERVRMMATPANYWSARDKVERLAGSGYGIYPFWQDGDPVSDTSLLGKLLETRDEFQRMQLQAEAACDVARANDMSNENAMVEGQIAVWQGQTDADFQLALAQFAKAQAERTSALTGPLFGLAAIAAALFWKK